MLCLRIHRGLPQHGNEPAWVHAKAAHAAEFLASDLTAHFKAEEEVLFPAMRGFVGAPELLNALLGEHRELERLGKQLRVAGGEPLVQALSNFAGLLEAHIRKEERGLFPLYEKQAGAELADRVGQAVREIIGEAMQPRNPELLK